jgi:orotate phosphoribosyltransferase
VVSTGRSLLKSVDRIRDLGARVVAATALVDRSPAVAERFAAAGIEWLPLLTWADLDIAPL